MGQAANRKKERRAQLRDRPALIEKVREQLELLDVLGTAFDDGRRVVGYPLATVVRVLVHDTAQSKALLGQLGDLSTMTFADTSLPIDPRNLLTHAGLAHLRLEPGAGGTWVPYKSVPHPWPGAERRDIAFDRWWTTNLMKDSDGILWSRKRIIGAIANKEGGAHVQPTQPIDVRAIEAENSMHWSYHDPIVGDQPMSKGPLLASVRQIAYELELSLREHPAGDFGASS